MSRESNAERHRRMKWFWIAFDLCGLVDFAIRGNVLAELEKPLAASVPVLFFLSVAALAVGEWAAEEASS